MRWLVRRGTHATGAELAAKFTAALGEKVIYRPMTTDQMRASGQPLAVEVANNFQFYSDASEYFTGARDLDLVRELNPELQTLDSWLTQHKSEIPSAEFRIPPTSSGTIRAARCVARIRGN